MTEDQAVSLKHLPNAVYDRGKTRTNRLEAEAVVADAIKKMKSWINLPEEDRLTLGVITFNTQQQSLIQDLFDEALRENPELEWFFDDDRVEPTVVKNLENVQGDERDVMLFSIANGPSKAGKMSLNFGALNRQGGERRLNVAVTRARQKLVVYVSFLPEQLKVEGTKAQGVHDLKSFLEYAQKGSCTLEAGPAVSKGEMESPFEEAVAAALTANGWQVVPQIGVSGFRIDLGIVHPEHPGTFLAGIECDGATYHRSATARDRDKIREQVLRNLGWELIRVWSPDWWYDKAGAIERIHSELNQLLETSRKQTIIPVIDDSIENESAPESSSHSNEISEQKDTLSEYLRSSTINADLFYKQEYSPSLKEMIEAIIQEEAPIREDVLAQKIARIHGWNRTGKRIRDRVNSFLKEATFTEESTGRFVWNDEGVKEVIDYRTPGPGKDRRPVDEIALAELRGFIIANKTLLSEEDAVLAIAREMGINRLTTRSRQRLQEAIDRAKEIL